MDLRWFFVLCDTLNKKSLSVIYLVKTNELVLVTQIIRYCISNKRITIEEFKKENYNLKELKTPVQIEITLEKSLENLTDYVKVEIPRDINRFKFISKEIKNELKKIGSLTQIQ